MRGDPTQGGAPRSSGDAPPRRLAEASPNGALLASVGPFPPSGFRSGPTIRKGILALADQAVVSATNLLTGLAVGRACGREELGLYALGIGLVLLATNLQTSLISSPYTTYSPRFQGRSLATYTGSSLIEQGVLALGMMCLLAALAWFTPTGLWVDSLRPVLRVLAVCIGFMMLREHLRQLAFANLHLQLALLLDVSVAVAQLGGLAALWLAASLNAASAFVVSAVAAALGAVLWGTMSRVPVAFSADQIAPNFKRNWTLGRWLAGARVLSVLSIQAYPWMLAVFRGTGSAGYLAACQGTVGFTNVLLLAGGNLMYPITAHSRARSGPRETVVVGLRGSILYGVLFAPLLAILVGFGAEIVVTLYGTLYAGAGSVVRVLALSQLVLCVLIPLESALVALERRRVILVGHGAGFAATVILGAILTATWGPLGGAYGLLLYYASVATVFFWAVARTWLAQGHE